MFMAKLHPRLLYYLAWIVPVIVASLANYLAVVDSNANASWTRYLFIHFFYWMALACIGEIAYRHTPPTIFGVDRGLAKYFRAQGAILFAALLYFSFYYRIVNPAKFDVATSGSEWLRLMFVDSGAIAYHLMNTVTYAAVTGGCYVIRQNGYAQRQAEERSRLELVSHALEARLAQSRLTALNNQIHPHFLFNAMNSIASLISAGNTGQAYTAVTMLGGLLRDTLAYATRHDISLKREIRLVETMLKIGRLRFDDRLSWCIDVPPDLKRRRVPPFLVQPLVENALRHAVERTLAPVQIDVTARAANAGLTISVSDNGPGKRENTGDAGVGLSNIRERLELMSGGLASLRISEPAGGGFRVELHLPDGERQ